MEKSRAILIRRHRFSETSLLCIWITGTHGKVKTSARGALQAKSTFRGKLDVFHEVEIGFDPPKSGEIHNLREAILLHPFDGPSVRYANLAVAAYFGDLTDLATEASAPANEIFTLLARAVAYLRITAPTHRAVLFFEEELCKILGIHSEKTDPLQSLTTHLGRIPKTRQPALKIITPR